MDFREELKFVKMPVHGSSFEKEIIDFSSSVINLKLDIKSLFETEDIFRYPDSENGNLRKIISKIYELNMDNTLAGNGVSELLWFVGLAFIKKNMNVAILEPTYEEYSHITSIMGGRIFPFILKEEEHFELEMDRFLKFLKDNEIKLLFLCNPNNPTGKYLNQDKIEFILKNFDGITIFDYSYIDYVEAHIKYGEFIKKYDVLFLFSLTKSYGIAGLRAGFMLASEKIINLVKKVKTPWNMNIVAQKVASYILENRELFLPVVRKYKKESDILRLNIENSGFKTVKSETDYFMVKVNDAEFVKKELLKENFLIRSLTSKGLNNFIRINSGTKEENTNFFEKFVKSCKKYNC